MGCGYTVRRFGRTPLVVLLMLLFLPRAVSAQEAALDERVQALDASLQRQLYEASRTVHLHRLEDDRPEAAKVAAERVALAEKKLRALMVFQAKRQNVNGAFDPARQPRDATAQRDSWGRGLDVNYANQLRQGAGPQAQADLMARLEMKLRVLMAKEAAAWDMASAVRPAMDDTDPEVQAGRATEGMSRTVFRMRQLGEALAAVETHYPTIEHTLHHDWFVYAAKLRGELLLREYKHNASVGLILDPRTGSPAAGRVRREMAGNAMLNLADQLGSVNAGRLPLFKLLWPQDSQREFAAQIESEVARWLDYQALAYLDAGMEPSPEMAFLAMAQVMRAQAQQMEHWYSNEYLSTETPREIAERIKDPILRAEALGKIELEWPKSFYTSLDQLLRANGFDTATDGSAAPAVRQRVDWFIRETDAAAGAFVAAADSLKPQDGKPLGPKRLGPKHLSLLKQFGYIATAPDGAMRYVIDSDARGVQMRLDRVRGRMDLPGSSWLSVITPKTVATTAVSVIVPELTVGPLMAAAATAEFSAVTMMGLRLALDTTVGAGVAVGLDAVEHGMDNVDLGAVFRDTFLLGVPLMAVGEISQAAVKATLKRMAAAERGSIMHRLLTSNGRYRMNVEQYLVESMDMASETVATAALQNYINNEEVDGNSVMSILLQGAMSRAVSTAYHETTQLSFDDFKALVPERLRPQGDDAEPVMRYLHQKVVERLAAEAAAKARFDSATGDNSSNAGRLFMGLAKGDVSWTDLKRVYATDQGLMHPVMVKIAKMREYYFERFMGDAMRLARQDLVHDYEKQFEMLEKNGAPPEVMSALMDRFLAEEAAVMKLPIAPGSDNPISDIDRSSSSPWLRRRLRQLYEGHVSWFKEGVIPTSASAFDANEYINGFPHIAENRQYAMAMGMVPISDGPGAGMVHSEAMEALSMAAAMLSANSGQRTLYQVNARGDLAMRIKEAGIEPARAQEMKRLMEMQLAHAKEQLRVSRDEVAAMRDTVLKEKGLEPGAMDAAELDLLARDALYDKRMSAVNEKLLDLRGMKNQNDPEAIALRAEIDRMVSQAMRDGVETYSQPSGLDIVVLMVQMAKKPNGKKMKVADRLNDDNFTLKGELKNVYTEREVNAVINDQIMFLVEHVNGFYSGHETAYEAGRAMGKYLERAFLAMKIKGLDINAVRARDASDPTRRLLEFSQELVKNKESPAAVSIVLEKYASAVGGGASPEHGLYELFRLMDQVMPGMKGMTDPGLVHGSARLSPDGLQSDSAWTSRSSQAVALARGKQAQKLLEVSGGAAVAMRHLNGEAATLAQTLQRLRAKVADIERWARRYQHKDWDKVAILEDRLAGAELMFASLPWAGQPRSPIANKLRASVTSMKSQLDELGRGIDTSTELDKDALKRDSRPYAQAVNRLRAAEALLAWTQRQRRALAPLVAYQAHMQRFSVAGKWVEGEQDPSPGGWQIQADHAGDLVALHITNPKWSRPGPHMRVIGRYRFGRLEGQWEALGVPMIVVRPGEYSAPPRGFFEAQLSRDGRVLTFTKTSSTQANRESGWGTGAVVWAGRSFRHEGPVLRQPQDGFLTQRRVVVPRKPSPPAKVDDKNLNPADARLLVRQHGAAGEQLSAGVILLDSRDQSYEDNCGTNRPFDTAPGTYDLDVHGSRVSGVQLVAGKVTVVQMPAWGRVALKISDPDGKPVQGVHVQVYQDGKPFGITTDRDRSGRYVKQVPNGRFELGFTMGGRSYKRVVNVVQGQESLVQVQAGGLRFRVTSPQGQPLGKPSLAEADRPGATSVRRFGSGPLAVAPGVYRVTWDLGNSPYKIVRQVAVGAGRWKTVQAQAAELRFSPTSHTRNLQVKVDDGPWHRLANNTQSIGIPPGKVTVKWDHQGKTHESTVEIPAGEFQRVLLNP